MPLFELLVIKVKVTLNGWWPKFIKALRHLVGLPDKDSGS